MTNQVNKWKGEFGHHYHTRNFNAPNAIENRKSMWQQILNIIVQDNDGKCPEKYLEVGAGNGQNLISISELYKELATPTQLSMVAVEPNEEAAENIQQYLPACNVVNQSWEDSVNIYKLQDVVFTSGVLIHVHPDKLEQFTDKIVATTAKYIVCLEYFSPECRNILYRGEKDLLWSNDFGSIYLKKGGLRLVMCHFFWKPIYGVDNLTCWVFAKTN